LKEILYGRHAVEETVLAGRRKVHRLLMAEGSRLPPASTLLKAAESKGIPVEWVPRQRLDQIGNVNHQGVAAEASAYPYIDVDDLLQQSTPAIPPMVLVLDCLQDPQNFGALIRTAEAVGVTGVVLPRYRSVSVTSAVVNASAGAVEHLKVALAPNLVAAMEKMKKAGFWLVGLEDVPGAQRYDQADLNVPLGLVVGSEGQGLGRLVRRTCDYVVRLPMSGQIASLNASIAGSIVLYEAWRQRHGQAQAEHPSARPDPA
jgi:23S rRNA (guanosine2251-2'-O)-methyltransferase